jgi:hypothetical protein
MQSTDFFIQADGHRVEAFEDRYGPGSYQRLLVLFSQPCATFAEIASRFGVTRERVRQWHLELLPDAPRGHARQRLCWIQHQKRQLLEDPLFRAFYRHARAFFAPSRFVLIPARDGFRKRSVRLDGHIIALRNARRLDQVPSGDAAPWLLTTSSSVDTADFIYYRLGDDGYVFVPRRMLPPAGTAAIDSRASVYQPYRNSFAPALTVVDEGQQAS